MRKEKNRLSKLIIAFALIIAISVVYMPAGAGAVYGATFSSSGTVTGLKVTGYTPSSISLDWDSYTGAKGYQVYKASSKDGNYSKIKTIDGSYWRRTGLTTNKTCYYKVRAYYVDSSGKEYYSKFSNIVAGTPSSFSTLKSVAGLKVTGTTSSTVTLDWDAYTDATGYQVYKATSKEGTYSKIQSTKNSYWKRTGLTANKTCYYKVRAYYIDLNGKEYYSKFSSVIAGTPYGFSTSNTVSGINIYAYTSDSVTIDWDAYNGATGYQVYKSATKDGSYSRIHSTKNSYWKRTGLTANKTCYYKVRAYYINSSGKEYYSKFSSVIAGTPYSFSTSKSVTGLKVTGTTSSTITLDWDAYTKATGYQIYKSATKDGEYSRLYSTKNSYWKRTGLTANKTCYYKVRAYYINSSGKEYYSKFSSMIAATPKGFNTSGKPADFRIASRTYQSVNMKWSAYSRAEGYEIYKATSKEGSYSKIKTMSGTSYNRTGLTTNTTCYYKIRAYDYENDKKVYSQFSAPIAGTPRMTTPSITVTGKEKSVKISWNAIAGASEYELCRATSKNGEYDKKWTTPTLTFSNITVTKDKYYYYKVRAIRTVDGKKKYSSYSEVHAGATAPGRIGSVSATSVSDGIKLDWADVSGATGYVIRRATGSGSFTKVGTSSTSSFKDVNVTNGLTYHYKVKAYRKLDGGYSYGPYNKTGYSRTDVVSTAVKWLGCRESNGTHKPIIDLYNKNMGTHFSYRDPWCAMFVSAVAIKSGTTSIIIRGSYCPSIINTYKNSKTSNYRYGSGSKYVPKAGDVIFFDWNYNGVPDHTGMVASVSGKTVKTIEGNYSDAVGYRTFSVGYSAVQGYGLPNYDSANGIVYTGKSTKSVGCGELSAMGIGTAPDGASALGEEYDFVEQKVEDNIGCGDGISDVQKMSYMIKKVRTNAETDGINCSESQYYAAFIYKLCEEADIDSSIMTAVDGDGKTHAWVEAALDGNWYKIDASKSKNQMEKFVHETTDIEE